MKRLLSIVLIAAMSRQAWAQGTAPTGSRESGASEIEASALSKVPKQVTFSEAEYPAEAAAKGVEGEVVLLLDIDNQGRVAGVGLAEPATPSGLGFDEAAMLAAQFWAFEPAEVDGKPIAVQIAYRYRFVLRPKEAPLAEARANPASDADSPTPRTEAPPVVNFAGLLVERGARLPLRGVVVTVFRDEVPATKDAAEPPVERPTGFEATTDQEGRFSFTNLRPGPWKVLVEAPGHYPFRTTETIPEGQRIDATYYVERASYNPYDVTVTEERPRKEVSRTVISRDEIDKVPGGFGDPLSVVKNFAGVARTERPNELVVRGSAPEDTRIFIEGTQVPMLYHFGGIKSVLPIGMMDSLEFYPGNFAPAYGRAIGGIIDVRTKALRPEKVGGYVDASILDTGFFVEAPLGDEAALAVAGRRSHIDALMVAALSDREDITLTTAPRYYDFQLLGSYRPKRAHDFRLFAFGSNDELRVLRKAGSDLNPDEEDHEIATSTTFYRAILAYNYRPGGGFENELTVAGGYDETALRVGEIQAYSELLSGELRETARYELAKELTLSSGFDMVLGLSDSVLDIPRMPAEGQPESELDRNATVTSEIHDALTWAPAVFLEADFAPLPSWHVLPGVRLDYFDGTDELVAEPRITTRGQVSDEVTLKAGVGLFAQEPTGLELDPHLGNPVLDSERALHYSAGVEYRPWDFLTLDATAFYKDMWSLVSPTSTLVEDGSALRPLVYDNTGQGRAYGLELVVRHAPAHNLSGWIAYTLSRSERLDSGSDEYRLFDYDQTHILTGVVNYLLPRNWEVGARVRFITGNPNTPVIGAVYNASKDEYEPTYGTVNSGRDGAFMQLDLRIDKRWVYQSWMLTAYLDVQNVTNAENPVGVSYNFDYTKSEPETGFPLLPILGLRAEF